VLRSSTVGLLFLQQSLSAGLTDGDGLAVQCGLTMAGTVVAGTVVSPKASGCEADIAWYGGCHHYNKRKNGRRGSWDGFV
jgi:hypothetical protein